MVRVAPELSTVESHEIATQVEGAVRADLPVEAVTVHVEPDEAGLVPKDRRREPEDRIDRSFRL